ncbi:unnamed protein product [Cuscuta campestris]|uniref:Uncharacterized protein n=1 Tax=Cuscuta campestris TaxID=132261 RepID=A0A484L5K0_9ASTE|nr:unnamed protein product [Cuscuta campestris]
MASKHLPNYISRTAGEDLRRQQIISSSRPPYKESSEKCKANHVQHFPYQLHGQELPLGSPNRISAGQG